MGVVPDDDSRAWGGPHYADLEQHLTSRPREDDGTVDVGAAFRSAPERLRRPVDLLGLLELAHRHGMVETGQVVTVEAVRPDGTRRRFAFGGVAMTDEHEGKGGTTDE